MLSDSLKLIVMYENVYAEINCLCIKARRFSIYEPLDMLKESVARSSMQN